MNQTSKKAFESCGLAGGSWKRQFAEAQAEESTRIHAPKHQEMIDLFELYADVTLSFKQFMTGDGAQPVSCADILEQRKVATVLLAPRKPATWR